VRAPAGIAGRTSLTGRGREINLIRDWGTRGTFVFADLWLCGLRMGCGALEYRVQSP